MRLSQLASVLKAAMQTDAGLEDDWLTVKNWSEASRYESWDRADAQSLVKAIERQSGGILPWIKLRW